jgi:UDP-N-acetylmuramoyl-L-alanyl-D-glutamate--2,6-diaminopimelate ligase
MTIAGATTPTAPRAPVRTERAFVRHSSAPFPLRVDELAREIPGARLVATGAEGARITGVHHDSRRIEPGDLFVARSGSHADGARFVAEAIAGGAAAVLATRDVPVVGAAKIEVDDVPVALAYASAAVYGHPTFALEVVGITGTNGKTTTAHLVQAVIDGCGGRAGIVGTLGARFADLDLPPTLTSPEADELARIARAMRSRGAEHLVMEVSSIALIARRSDAVRFRVAAFTNLTQDHLDYHGSMSAYGEAKARLFVDLAPGSAAINVDDAFGRELALRVHPAGGPRSAVLARFSARVGATVDEAEIAPLALTFSRAGIAITARTPGGVVEIASPLFGAHNAQNLLAALAIAWLLDLDVYRAAQVLSTAIGVPGRLERVDTPDVDDVIVLVDYAHTPDALARVLESVKILGENSRIVCVFGCGGDRDPKKRPLMGEAVGRGAAVAIVTNDNPRSEDPRAIADAILPGLAGTPAQVIVELDRRAAMERAIVDAEPGDVIVLAGKGHEPYQIVGAVTHAFDDRDEARRALAIRRAGRGAR